MSTSTTSIAADLGEQYKQLFGAELRTVADPRDLTPDAPFLLVPSGLAVKSLKPLLDEYLPHPVRRTGTAQLRDKASFIAHVTRFQDQRSAIFANPDRAKPSVTAVFDYHEEVGSDADTAAPNWLQHRAVYACPLSDEWLAWAKVDGQSLAPLAFAEFLEDRIGDVILPAADDTSLVALAELIGGRFAGSSALMTLARGLAINVETQVRQALTLQSGEIAITYAETHKDGEGAPIRVANLFLVAIPVFYGGAPYRIPVRLRYRLREGKLSWSFHLYRADCAFDDAFREVTTSVAAETKLPVFLGTPEA